MSHRIKSLGNTSPAPDQCVREASSWRDRAHLLKIAGVSLASEVHLTKEDMDMHRREGRKTQLGYLVQTLSPGSGSAEHRTHHRKEGNSGAVRTAGSGVGGALLVVLRSSQADSSCGSSGE